MGSCYHYVARWERLQRAADWAAVTGHLVETGQVTLAPKAVARHQPVVAQVVLAAVGSSQLMTTLHRISQSRIAMQQKIGTHEWLQHQCIRRTRSIACHATPASMSAELVFPSSGWSPQATFLPYTTIQRPASAVCKDANQPELGTGATRRCLPAKGGYTSHISGPSGPNCARSRGFIRSQSTNRSVRMKTWPSSCTTSWPVARGVKRTSTSAENRTSLV